VTGVYHRAVAYRLIGNGLAEKSYLDFNEDEAETEYGAEYVEVDTQVIPASNIPDGGEHLGEYIVFRVRWR